MTSAQEPTPTPEPGWRPSRTRKARWLGIVIVLVVGGGVAAWTASLPDSTIGMVIAYTLLAVIVLLVVARFVPDSWFGGRVGRNRDRAR